MKKYLILLFLTLEIIIHDSSSACTIFNATKGDTTLVGNTEDAPYENAWVWFFPAKEGKYGRVLFDFRFQGNDFPQGGMNDQGLFYDWAALPPRSDVIFPTGLLSYNGWLCGKMLEECATVNEAIAFYRTYKDPELIRSHIMVVDKSGNSAIIEWGQSEMAVVQKKEYYQVMTNFNTTVTSNAFIYPCPRYNYVNNTFKNNNEVSVDRFRKIMEAVDSDGSYWAHTVYSNTYDLQRRRVYLYYLRNYDKVIIFDLDRELAKGEHVYDLKPIFSLNFIENNTQTITTFNLLQNYPNPFNSETTIKFDLPANDRLVLSVYNTAGQIVRTLIDREIEAGSHSIVWNGQDTSGRAVASGVYLYRLETLDRGFVEAKRMVLMR